METKKKRKTFSEQFKKQIVDLYNCGKSVSELSRDYEIGQSTISRKGQTHQYHRFHKRKKTTEHLSNKKSSSKKNNSNNYDKENDILKLVCADIRSNLNVT